MDNSGSRIDPSDTALLFVDLQSGIFELSKTVALDRLAKGVLGLSRLAKIFGIPAVVSGVSGQNGEAPEMISQLADGIGTYSVHVRMTADSFRNEAIVAAIKATGRHTLLISGVSSEVAVQLPALSAADSGYRVFVVADACGGMSGRTEKAAFDRITKAGGDTGVRHGTGRRVGGGFSECRGTSGDRNSVRNGCGVIPAGRRTTLGNSKETAPRSTKRWQAILSTLMALC